jgi:ABC-type dipeptide/oligopeptide/nickel transport system ATPase component
MTHDALLSVDGLEVEFASSHGPVAAVRGIRLSVRREQVVGIVGESGSGKSVTALSILGLLHPRARVLGGSVSFAGSDLLQAPERELARIRGRRISLVPQDPMTALNPGERIGGQLAAAIRTHRGLGRAEARAAAAEALAAVQIPEPEAVLRRYPYQLSGGQRQRVVIALALAGEPELLIADEATTALDVTTQHQILTLLRERAVAGGMSVMLITHDLGVVADVCEYVYVIRDGVVVEEGAVAAVLDRPRHEYTRQLLDSFPDPARRGEPLGALSA